MSFSKPQVSFSSNFAWHFSVMKDNSSALFLGQTLHILHKRDQSKCKFLRLLSTWINIHLILVIFENFLSLFSAMGHNFSVFFWLKFYILSTKWAYQSTNLVKFWKSEKSKSQSKVWKCAFWLASLVNVTRNFVLCL